MEIEDIAKVIANLTPDCSGNIHQWKDLRYEKQIHYIEKAKIFVNIANVLIEMKNTKGVHKHE